MVYIFCWLLFSSSFTHYPHASNGEAAVFIALESEDSRIFTDAEISISIGLRKLYMPRRKVPPQHINHSLPETFIHNCFLSYNFPAGVANVKKRILADHAGKMVFTIGMATTS